MLSKIPKKVGLHDLTPRDGFQREEIYIPVAAKLFIIEKLIDAGYKHIEVTNLANPKNIPQFADADELIGKLPRVDGVEYTVITINQKALDRAISHKQAGANIHRILINTSTSELHHKANSGKTHAEAWEFNKKAVKQAQAAGLKVCGCVTTIFGCPFAGKMQLGKAWDWVDRYMELGVDDIEHADHDGECTPDRAYEYFTRVMEKYPDPKKHVFHIHDSRGMGLGAYYAALTAGVTQFESTLGGIGGQPANILDRVPVPGTGEYYVTARRSGLVCTEDLVSMLDAMYIDTGIDVRKVFSLGRRVEQILGRNLWSFASTAGKLPFGYTEVE